MSARWSKAMPTHIQATINNLIADKITEEGDQSPTAIALQALSKEAILAGQLDDANKIKPQWRKLMVFLLTRRDDAGAEAAADPADLARLLPEDGTMDNDRQQERAYIAGNAMCGTPTSADIILNGNLTAALDK
jgi:hypothetical protein